MKYLCKNLEIIPSEIATVSALSSAVFYGYGVFTTIAIFNQKPFQWDLHLQRLQKNAERLRIKIPFDEGLIKSALLDLITKNELIDGKARITIFEEEAPSMWSATNMRQPCVLITTAANRSQANEMKLTISSHPVNSKSSLRGIKSCNYLENLLELEAAKTKGFDEALRLNENSKVVSACMANIFWIDGENVYTPSAETGCLQGTTRAFVIELCRSHGFDVYTTFATIDELLRADEVFLTSAGLGIMPVRKIADHFFENYQTENLRKAFEKIVSSL